MGRRTCCTFPDCEEPKAANEAMCREHTDAWMRSAASVKAACDKAVVFWFRLGARETALKEVAKHRRRWAKAEAAREEEGA